MLIAYFFGLRIGNIRSSGLTFTSAFNDKVSSSTNEEMSELNEELRNIAINIKSQGARTDGTDSTQAFIKARAKSKYIFVPEGVYIIEKLILKDVVLFGNGTLKWKGATTSFMMELKGRCVVKGLTFDGNASLQNSIKITAIKLTNADNTSIKNNIFTNFHSKVIFSDIANSPNVQVLSNRFENCGTTKGCDVVTVKSSDWIIRGNFFINIGDGHCVRLGLYNNDPTVAPIERIIITENTFEHTQHVGVTCEIYTQNVLITGNIFESLEQAVKCESEGGTVYDITISNNIIRNITSSTALNLSVKKIKFTNNKCYNLAGGPYFGDFYDCSNNEFYNCGSLDNGVISNHGSPLQGIIANNLIVNPRYRGIEVSGGTITGNRIINCPDQAIGLSKSGLIVNNYIKGAKNGIVLLSSVSNSIINNNIFLSISETSISFSNNVLPNNVIIKDNLGAGN
ncbi:hypothetical protein CN514_23010 [Bacillus sp. AFS001701]|uniref:right-handed parallel beta-helix repeat-containing protein n=1 Tax=Bacillus sp. AFS001701 TaxID=2033480 RepID=UPI000BF7FA28|nr:right-handed parallel beta-helix repeat-containing protein [Bacillus sp. AFS001701]PET42184.1 hypothetical protein CN514_23010 [Bacillus sp. AFS001701]